MKRKKETWALNPDEVIWGGGGGSSGRRKHATRQGRMGSVTEAKLHLIHVPTGIEVSGNVPPGRYSRSEMQVRRAELYETLFQKLENMVASHLNVPGR